MMMIPNSVSDMKKYLIICDRCRKSDYIPFKPTEGTPIFCNRCHDKIRREEQVWLNQGSQQLVTYQRNLAPDLDEDEPDE